MNVMSRYSFISQFNKENISRQEANANGIGTIDFKKCDSNSDGILSVDEILANQDVCEKLLKAIQSKIDKITNEENVVKSEFAKEEGNAEKFDKAAWLTDLFQIKSTVIKIVLFVLF